MARLSNSLRAPGEGFWGGVEDGMTAAEDDDLDSWFDATHWVRIRQWGAPQYCRAQLGKGGGCAVLKRLQLMY